MTVVMWICPEHNLQPPKIVDRFGIARCPECGARLDRTEYGTAGPGTAKR